MKPLYIQQIRLFQYKNYEEKLFHFQPTWNAIVGKNAIGKTNLLDAIYTLSFTKSYFSKNENLYLNHQCNSCSLQAKYKLNEDDIFLDFIIRDNNKKEILFNRELIKKYATFIGTIPIIMICPDDVELINGIAEIRRNFLDKFLSQINQDYLQNLIQYNKILFQKNALLKDWHLQKNMPLLDVYNEQLEPFATSIFEYRKNISEQLIAYTKEYYYGFASSAYEIQINYQSQLLQHSWKALLQIYKDKETQSQRNLMGIQKDDLVFELNPYLFKETASQGQKKSLLLALKLATLKIIADEKKITPILLLDDIFEKLDDKRLHHFFTLINKFSPIQIVLSDVNKERVVNTMNAIGIACNLIEIE